MDQSSWATTPGHGSILKNNPDTEAIVLGIL